MKQTKRTGIPRVTNLIIYKTPSIMRKLKENIFNQTKNLLTEGQTNDP